MKEIIDYKKKNLNIGTKKDFSLNDKQYDKRKGEMKNQNV